MVQNYKVDTLTLVQNQAVRSDCADITFFNQGTAPVLLNSAITLPQGSSIVFSANNGEIDRTLYNISFSGAGTQRLVVFRKIYI